MVPRVHSRFTHVQWRCALAAPMLLAGKGNSMTKKPLIAIVDDDESMRETMKDLLDSAGFSAVTFTSAESFLKSKRARTVPCLITDMRMPGMTGLELHQRLVAAGRSIPTILITAYPDDVVRAQAAKAGILCYLPKPFASEVLLECVDSALRGQGPGSGQPSQREGER